jgi:hypothetical protein
MASPTLGLFLRRVGVEDLADEDQRFVDQLWGRAPG